ncbi:uncharacterized protein LOC128670517 isoform X1 [Plodia interpunctella]|uniref:uncharacterized protein LOC128670517 isoform X1 n=1 Tax=Plodia interpunctella TaxID=58824 RepID=UPI002367E2DF|nr:uncharacterized protein LOC128670517 isoform X1 [Plodia interpunctella]XP_053602216.1 uncharacterized protein LOC128670517 isoform X1 [Plodia interpunctella]
MWFPCLYLLACLWAAHAQNVDNIEFLPVVNATCKTGVMSIRVTFNQPFNGIIHAREYRNPSCMAQGNGTEVLTFDINLVATQGSPDYCGVFWNNRTDERSLPLAVRVHRTLELADDKFYVITCGKAGFRNSRNETSLVSLRMLNQQGQKVLNAAFGLPYTLRAELSKSDGTHGIRLKNCFAFNMKNNTVDLLDSRGCPLKHETVVTKSESGAAELTISSMFRFPDSSQVNFQCDIGVCRGSTCGALDCTSADRSEVTDEEGTVTASTGVFVLDPNDNAVVMCAETGVRPLWLLYLAIALGVMFLVMLLVNCFLCTAMTCSCARTDVIEKDPSVVEDYDPYRSWHGSQYGGRYPSSTIHSARSVSDNSDHYAIVQSRPGSRHSGMHRNRH